MSEKSGKKPGSGGRPPIVDLEFVQGLIAAVDQSGVDSLEISRGGTRIRISKSATPGPAAPQAVQQPGAVQVHHEHVTAHATPAPPPPPAGAAESAAPVPTAPGLLEIKSPMVGTFYRSPNPDSPPYVEVGSKVAQGQTLCILEAMKLMNELDSDVAGVVREICVENGEPVEYGQILFRIAPEG